MNAYLGTQLFNKFLKFGKYISVMAMVRIFAFFKVFERKPQIQYGPVD
jgi:hypothetical protein